jgi:hypothetical protein
VNTAARMESTGRKGRIQLSPATAELLRKAGKESWLVCREDKVRAKGKGVLSTFWLVLQDGIEVASSTFSVGEIPSDRSSFVKPSNDIDLSRRHNLKESRLIDWVADILLEHIKRVVIVHERCGKVGNSSEDVRYMAEEGKICLDEVQDCIKMPQFDVRVAEAALDSNKVVVPDEISDAVREYVAFIAGAYRNNPFHNFEVSKSTLWSLQSFICFMIKSHTLRLFSACLSCNNECQQASEPSLNTRSFSAQKRCQFPEKGARRSCCRNS